MINEVLTAPEEGFKVEGMDVRILLRLSFFMFTVVKLKCLQVGMVVVCGKVNVVERAATKTTYHLEDAKLLRVPHTPASTRPCPGGNFPQKNL